MSFINKEKDYYPMEEIVVDILLRPLLKIKYKAF